MTKTQSVSIRQPPLSLPASCLTDILIYPSTTRQTANQHDGNPQQW